MNFKNGDLAVIVGGAWHESIGRVVRVVWKCHAHHGKGVAADGLNYWLSDADGGPIYLVRLESAGTLPAGTHSGQVLYRLKRRPVCGCHLRPLVRTGVDVSVSDRVETPKREEKELQAT